MRCYTVIPSFLGAAMCIAGQHGWKIKRPVSVSYPISCTMFSVNFMPHMPQVSASLMWHDPFFMYIFINTSMIQGNSWLPSGFWLFGILCVTEKNLNFAAIRIFHSFLYVLHWHAGWIKLNPFTFLPVNRCAVCNLPSGIWLNSYQAELRCAPHLAMGLDV